MPNGVRLKDANNKTQGNAPGENDLQATQALKGRHKSAAWERIDPTKKCVNGP
jgi:hypothetical protein